MQLGQVCTKDGFNGRRSSLSGVKSLFQCTGSNGQDFLRRVSSSGKGLMTC
jgi:hypothetical protein